MADVVLARAPGRVNLIGDHTDHTGGLVFPMAIDRYTSIEFQRRDQPWVEMVSANDPEPALIPLDVANPSLGRPAWARYVAGVIAVMHPPHGGSGFVTSSIPLRAGLASSAALVVASALALGAEGDREELARACQEAEQLAASVPVGIMDQMASLAGVEGHALLIDCETLAVEPVPVPDGIDVIVVDSGEHRELVASRYGVRRAQAQEAQEIVGSLKRATVADLDVIDDDTLRGRARHVVTENQRVREFADAFRSGDLPRCGELMLDSHASLRDDFEASTHALDDLVAMLADTPGVYGARVTGAGFGGFAVALADSGVELTLPSDVDDPIVVRASAGASVRPA